MLAREYMVANVVYTKAWMQFAVMVAGGAPREKEGGERAAEEHEMKTRQRQKKDKSACLLA